MSFSTNVASAAESIQSVSEIKLYIQSIERKNNIPNGLLLSIARVESNLKPFALNVEGKSIQTKNYAEAVSFAEKVLASGITNVDLGIMQINWRWHNERFFNVREMLSPKPNIDYAGELLSSLYKQHGSWHKAVRLYHSANPIFYEKYSRKVVVQWLAHT